MQANEEFQNYKWSKNNNKKISETYSNSFSCHVSYMAGKDR